MGFETYLIENINKMHDLIIQTELHPDDEARYLTEAAVIGCEALTRLSGDNSFLSTVQQMSAARVDALGHTRQEFLKVIDNLNSFEEFLKIEHELLLASGLFPDVAAPLIGLTRKALDEVRSRAKPAAEVMEAVRTLTDQACNTARDLLNEAAGHKKWGGLKDKLKRVMMGLGGAALVGVNAAAVLPTAITPVAALTIAMGAASTAFGVSIVQNATFPIANQASA